MSAATGEAAAVIVDEPVVIGEVWLRQKRGVGIRQVGSVDEQHRLTASLHPVLQLPTIDWNAIGYDTLLG